jgi:hypothetical protein
MTFNYVAILIAVVLQFAFGAFWYSAIFGKLWGKIMGFDKLSKSQQDALMKTMGPTYGVQFLSTLLTTVVLASMLMKMSDAPVSPYMIAFFVWLGFVLPSQISAVIFSRTERRYMAAQIGIMATEALARILIATYILSMWG